MLKQRTVDLCGTRYTITALPGAQAHDLKGHFQELIALGFTNLPGVTLSSLLELVKPTVKLTDGTEVDRTTYGLAMFGRFSLDQIASAIQALSSRLTVDEARWQRETLLRDATMWKNGVAVPFLDALQAGQVPGGPLTCDWLIAQAVALSIFPFFELLESGNPAPPPSSTETVPPPSPGSSISVPAGGSIA